MAPERTANSATMSSAAKSATAELLVPAVVDYPPSKRSSAMDWDRVQGSWKQLEGKVKAKWGKLTDNDLTAINGRREELEGKLQQLYGLQKDQVRKEVDAWFASQGF
jgi:uncharacterized protein YjbJ (UPF0337 family)